MTTTTREQFTDRMQQFQSDAREVSRRVWLAGLGTVSSVDEAGRSLWDDLVERGKKVETSRGDLTRGLRRAGDQLNGRLAETRERVERGVEDGMSHVLHRLGAPTRRDVAGLIERVERLTAKVENLEKS